MWGTNANVMVRSGECGDVLDPIMGVAELGASAETSMARWGSMEDGGAGQWTRLARA